MDYSIVDAQVEVEHLMDKQQNLFIKDMIAPAIGEQFAPKEGPADSPASNSAINPLW